ncbi:hypothetical protein RC856_003335 [Vibrio fluvialis]|nr:hypothetical protein [Vibrio fluvialis]MBY7805733.1 hypothetical protein [Vibrio fluvialis]
MEERKVEFLYQSISDSQGTIRALDVKLGFFFVVIFLPLVALKEIMDIYKTIEGVCYYFIPSLISVLAWVTSFLSLFFSALSIGNPMNKIDTSIDDLSEDTKSAFYNGNIFQLNILSLVNSRLVKVRKNLREKTSSLPSDMSKLIYVLSLESMKLSYIREVKIYRINICMYATLVWIFLGSLIWVLSFFGVGLNG